MSTQLQIGAVGIDFGSSRSVLAVAKRGGVDVLANEASLRETRNIVGYGALQRFTGEAANAQVKRSSLNIQFQSIIQNQWIIKRLIVFSVLKAKSNFKNTISSFNRLLGLSANYPKLKEEAKWISSKLGTNEEGKIVSEVTYKGQNLKLLPEQVTAAMLGDIRKIISLNNLANNEAVISVPSYYTEAERKSLRDACKIAGLSPVKLLNENSAICLSYGLFRKSELEANVPRHVAFVDFGHSKFSCFVGEFTNEKVKIVAQLHERNLGARDIDWEVFQHFSQKFEKAHGLSVSESKKGQMRLFDAIEKMRKILSANIEADCHCEYLVEDQDLNETLTREQFEKLAEPILIKIQQYIKTIVAEINQKKIKLHSVEIVGGAVRIPSVQNIIQSSFGVPSLFKTLNQSECIARGCAMMSAMMSPQFKVANYGLEEMNYYPINISWDFFNYNDKGEKTEFEGKQSTLFEKGCDISKIKSIAFSKSDGVNVNLYYAQPPEGFDAQLSNIVIAPCKPKEQEFGVKIKLKFDKDGLISLEEALLVEDFIVEEKIPIKTDKQAIPPPTNTNGDNSANQNPQADQQSNAKPSSEASNETNANVEASKEPPIEFEIKKKKKTRNTNLVLENVSQLYSQTKDALDYLTKIQNEHVQSDDLIINTLHKKNELESFIYSWRSKLNGSHAIYTTPDVAQQMLSQLETTETWLYDAGSDSTFEEYNQRLTQLQTICIPIDKRFNEYTHLQQAVQALQSAIMESENFFISTDEKYQHITKEDKKPLSEEIDRIRIWLNNADQAQRLLKPSQDPAITCNEIQNNYNQLSKVYLEVQSKPKPEPIKQENNATKQQASSKSSNDGETATKSPTEGDSNQKDQSDNQTSNENKQ